MSDYATSKEIELGIRLIESVAKERITSLESKLAAAKAEIEELKQINAFNFKGNEHWQSETKRLRETIQRNEDKSVECERLREALEKIYNGDPEGIYAGPTARAALDGAK